MSDFPKHPAFAAHFTDPLYDDEGAEFAPFGTDEGWDMLAEWSERVDELNDASTVRQLLAEHGGDDIDGFIEEAVGDATDLGGIVIGAGFTLLRLTGRIDDEGRQWTLAALDAGQRFYAVSAPEFELMRRDLMTFVG